MVQSEENVLLSKEEYDNIVKSLIHEKAAEVPGVSGILNMLTLVDFSIRLKHKLFIFFGEGEEK